VLVEVFLVAGYFFANLYQSALGGWSVDKVAKPLVIQAEV
jgi:hypothetical protein